MDITKNTALTLVSELRQYDHAFLSREGALKFSQPFGFDAYTYVMQANPQDFKGLTLHDGSKEAEGIDAQDLAMQICDHLDVKYQSKFGRGSQLRACCDALEAHFKAK